MFFCPMCERGDCRRGYHTQVMLEMCEEFVRQQADDGRMVLFYPPPAGPYTCPGCGTTLEDI